MEEPTQGGAMVEKLPPTPWGRPTAVEQVEPEAATESQKTQGEAEDPEGRCGDGGFATEVDGAPEGRGGATEVEQGGRMSPMEPEGRRDEA